jgi:hypothetical protein
MHLLEGKRDEMTILMIHTRILVFVYVKWIFSLVHIKLVSMSPMPKQLHSY